MSQPSSARPAISGAAEKTPFARSRLRIDMASRRASIPHVIEIKICGEHSGSTSRLLSPVTPVSFQPGQSRRGHLKNGRFISSAGGFILR